MLTSIVPGCNATVCALANRRLAAQCQCVYVVYRTEAQVRTHYWTGSPQYRRGSIQAQTPPAEWRSSTALPASAEMAVMNVPHAMSSAARPAGQPLNVARLVKS